MGKAWWLRPSHPARQRREAARESLLALSMRSNSHFGLRNATAVTASQNPDPPDSPLAALAAAFGQGGALRLPATPGANAARQEPRLLNLFRGLGLLCHDCHAAHRCRGAQAPGAPGRSCLLHARLHAPPARPQALPGPPATAAGGRRRGVAQVACGCLLPGAAACAQVLQRRRRGPQPAPNRPTALRAQAPPRPLLPRAATGSVDEARLEEAGSTTSPPRMDPEEELQQLRTVDRIEVRWGAVGVGALASTDPPPLHVWPPAGAPAQQQRRSGLVPGLAAAVPAVCTLQQPGAVQPWLCPAAVFPTAWSANAFRPYPALPCQVGDPMMEARGESAALAVIAAVIFGAGVWATMGEQKGQGDQPPQPSTPCTLVAKRAASDLHGDGGMPASRPLTRPPRPLPRPGRVLCRVPAGAEPVGGQPVCVHPGV